MNFKMVFGVSFDFKLTTGELSVLHVLDQEGNEIKKDAMVSQLNHMLVIYSFLLGYL